MNRSLKTIVGVACAVFISLGVTGCAGTALHVTATPSAGVYSENKLAPPLFLGNTPLESKIYQGAPINNLKAHQLGYLASEGIHIPLSGEITHHFILTSYASAVSAEIGKLSKDFIDQSLAAVEALEEMTQASSSNMTVTMEKTEHICRSLFEKFPQYHDSALSTAIREVSTVYGLEFSRQQTPLAGEYLRRDAKAVEKKTLSDLRAILASAQTQR